MSEQNKSPPRHLPPEKIIDRLNDVAGVVEGFDSYLHALADAADEAGEITGTCPKVEITVTQAFSILNVFQFIRCNAHPLREALRLRAINRTEIINNIIRSLSEGDAREDGPDTLHITVDDLKTALEINLIQDVDERVAGNSP